MILVLRSQRIGGKPAQLAYIQHAYSLKPKPFPEVKVRNRNNSYVFVFPYEPHYSQTDFSVVPTDH